MYDEELVEDSLAFARQLKTFLNEKQAGAAGTSDTVQPASSAFSSSEQNTETKHPLAESSPAQQVKQVTQTQSIQPSVGQPRPVSPHSTQQVQTLTKQSHPAQQVQTPTKQSRPVQQVQTSTDQSRVTPSRPVQQSQQLSAQLEAKHPSFVQQDVSVADEAIMKLKERRRAEEELRQKEQLSQKKESADNIGTTSVEAETIRNVPENENKHTYEITIKFDLDSIKKKFTKIKNKLAAEPRTLEEVNAAMEENRQFMEEKGKRHETSPSEDSASIKDKAKGNLRKLPKLMRRKDADQAIVEDENIMDGDITSLENDSESRISARLEDAKEVISQKAPFVSRLVTNLIIFVFCIGIAYFFADFVTSYVAHQTTVEGESMEPTLSDGDNVIIQRLSYYFKEPSRYDVVVFPVGNASYDETSNKKTYFIKRVIGLPGETVQIIDGSVYINGDQLKDDKYALSDILEAGVAANPLVLGEDQYFVMGDNRNMSSDSRNSYVGLVNRNDIVGEAWMCIWPFSHFGSLKR